MPRQARPSAFLATVISSSARVRARGNGKTSILHAHGVDLDQVARRVAEVLQIDSSKIWTEGNRAVTIRARSLLCYWAIKKLGMTAVAVAKRVRLSEPTVLRAAERGKQLVDINGWNLV
jgi:putative transposase